VDHVVSTALKLVATVASVAGSMEPSGFVKQREKIVKSLNSKDESLQQIRQNELFAKYSIHLGRPLRENQRTRQRGVDMTSRAHGRVPLSDLTEAKHEKLIDQELWCRHVIPRRLLLILFNFNTKTTMGSGSHKAQRRLTHRLESGIVVSHSLTKRTY